MRVACLTAFPFDPDRPCGGVESVSINLAAALRRTGEVELHVVTADSACAQPVLSIWNGIHIHRLPQPAKKLLANAVGPGRILVQQYLSNLQPDIVHSHDVYGLMVQGLAIPRVFTVHGFIHRDTGLSGTKLAWLRARMWKHYELRGWRDQPHIISISPYVRERLHGLTPAVIHDIDNPIASEFFEIEPQPVSGVVFCAATISRLKNQLALVKAAALLKAAGIKCEIRLAGPLSHSQYVQQVRNQIEQEGLKDCVHLLGSIGQEQIRRELAAARVFALVSLQENSPMGIEEAMAAGVPVLTSNRCGMPYMVRDGESGVLVDPTDPTDIAARLGELLSNDALCDSMGRKGKQIALDRFHADVVARRTIAVYQRILSGSSVQGYPLSS